MKDKELKWICIKDAIIHQIESGIWRYNCKLPSVRALSKRFGVSINTIQHALSELESTAYIRAIQRSGNVVIWTKNAAANPVPDLSSVVVAVDHSVVKMLSTAVRGNPPSFVSAVLQDDLVPHSFLKKCITTVVKKDDHNITSFLPPPGLDRLRIRIAGLMLNRGVICSPDDVLITSGDTIALELALAAVAKIGDTIAIEYPTYYGILQIIERLGMKALPIKTDPRLGIDIEYLTHALEEHSISAIFLNPTLHNPMGFVMDNEARGTLSAVAKRFNVPIIEDDIFFDLLPQDGKPRTLKSFTHHESTIYCSSFSKTVAPGYRVGWCVPGRFKNEILAQMFSRNLSVSSLPQYVLSEYLARGYLESHCLMLGAKFSRSTQFLANLVQTCFTPNTQYIPPVGGFIHWITLPPNTDMDNFLNAVANRGLHIGSSNIFYADQADSNNIRICLGRTLSSEIKAALKVLGDASLVSQLPSGKRQRPKRLGSDLKQGTTSRANDNSVAENMPHNKGHALYRGRPE
ncbi:aminotransferase class I/II-fold pyridoxal phosphate-dependent enzyme [Agrobacterium vitis]|uniref:Aminotransferase class I/II-fold pyridoxal phosphate-dependent enzyme n=1 Tax=Agrobacterium vitis TaxID=373 RepID=A0A7K1RNM9_AGRVI|nr:aminotransferase class I/II-fold pyridoxal phosphate-dependent enzyme [Agrobacterium vitis]